MERAAHAATFTTTIYADKDKYLNDEGGYSYGAADADTLLYVGDQAGYIYGINRTAVCFNLSDIAGKNISTAYLKIGVKYCSTGHNGGISIDVYGSSIDDWTEGDTSGSDTSFPSQNTLLTLSHYPIAFNNMPQIIWYSIDVTSFIQSEASGDGMATLVLSPAITGSYNECYFNSREGSDPDQLLVDYKVPSAALSASSSITESNVSGKVVNVTLEDGVTFADNTLDKSNFSLNGAPFTISSVSYTDTTHCSLALAYTGADFDSDKSISVTIGSAELSAGSSLTTNTIAVLATNDSESLAAATDGMITEGSENGEVINVTLLGGQLAATLTPSNWTVSGLPDGVSKGAVTRVDDTHATVKLSGNATGDYDNDITATVSCTKSEYTDNTGGGTLSAGFTLTAVNDAESLSVDTDGAITEGAKDGEVITATLINGTLAQPIVPSNWTLTGLPDGVAKGSVTRVNAHTVTIALSGNACDYDSDRTVTVSCSADEYEDSTGNGALQGFFNLNANNDAESMSASGDGLISEGSEDGEVITVTLNGGTFVTTVTAANWTVSGLPGGVTKGAVTRINDNTVKITLSGNATEDYDNDLTLAVSCTAAEYMDSTGGGTLSSNGITIKALDDEESLSAVSSELISEGSENGKTIIATLAGGMFNNILTAANWTVTGLPEGVSIGEVKRIDKNTAGIKLSGNAVWDYDNDIAVTVICGGTECINNTHISGLSAAGAVLTAINDEEKLTLNDDGSITEGAENGEVIIVTLTGGQFAKTLDAAGWTVGNLPKGVAKGSITRVDAHTVKIALSGNATEDYDNNIADIFVTCREGQYVSGSLPLTASIGVTLHAIVEKPTADDGDNDSENEHDAAASPSTGNSSSAEPSAAPTPSSTPTPTTSAQATGTISILKPLSVERDDETGLYVVVIDLSTLPKGTASIELNNGEVINVDEDSGVVRFEIIEEDIGKGGTIEITALDEEGVPLGNYKVQVKDASKAAADITKHAANILTTLLWIIGALFVAAAAVILTVILIKRKKTI